VLFAKIWPNRRKIGLLSDRLTSAWSPSAPSSPPVDRLTSIHRFASEGPVIADDWVAPGNRATVSG
jgi:hypothetical protein